jgi:hypothetical protein
MNNCPELCVWIYLIRWEDGIRMNLREIDWESVEWIQLAQDRDQWWAFVNTVMNLRVLAPQD